MHFLSHHIYRLFFLLEAFIDLRWLDYKTKCSTFSGNGMPWGKPHGPVRCNIHWKALGLKGLEMNVYNSCMWIYPRHAFQSPLKPSINQDALRTTKGCTLILGSGWGVKNIWKFRTWWNHPFEWMMYITTLFIHEHVPTLHLLTWIHLPARFCQVPHTRPGGWLGNMDVEKLDPISNAWLQIQIDHHIYMMYIVYLYLMHVGTSCITSVHVVKVLDTVMPKVDGGPCTYMQWSIFPYIHPTSPCKEKCRDLIGFAAADMRDAAEGMQVRPCPVLAALASVHPKKSDTGICIIVNIFWIICSIIYMFHYIIYIQRPCEIYQL